MAGGKGVQGNMNKPQRRAFVVVLDVPEGAKISDLRAYVEDAVATWCGSLAPDDPIFELDGDTVRAYVMPGLLQVREGGP